MSNRPSISLSDLTPEARERVEKQMRKTRGDSKPERKPRERRAMPIDDVRKHAIKVLNVVAELPASERERVLRQALKLNDV